MFKRSSAGPASSAASPVLAEGVRAAVPSAASPSAVLQRGLPAGRPALAGMAGPASVSGHRAGEGLPLPAEPPVSGAVSSATSPGGRFPRIRRAGGGYGRFRLSGRARGSAPSAVIKKIFLRPAGLLHLFRSPPAFPVAEVLLLLVPPGFTARPGTRGPLAARVSTPPAEERFRGIGRKKVKLSI